ncbi:hypothetical protein VNO77_11205 [Canavalia gladiata]|uniref:Uncharacterized protein n=1 Tax=Canavalia gladiata TaxID=3824 RepID=A0AAN9MHU6_CANGL
MVETEQRTIEAEGLKQSHERERERELEFRVAGRNSHLRHGNGIECASCLVYDFYDKNINTHFILVKVRHVQSLKDQKVADFFHF